MNRRSLLTAIAALPFVSRFMPASAADININPDSLVEAEIELDNVYARAGETVTCENGHPIFDFVETVHHGQMQNPAKHFGNWRQPEPAQGQFPIPGCAICGAPFVRGSNFHIGDRWRFSPGMEEWAMKAVGDGVRLTNISHPGA